MTDPKVNAYIAKSNEFAQPILNKLRALIHKAVPEVKETIKWGFPHFEYAGDILCSFAAFKGHCSFGFWKGKVMPDPERILETVGKTAMGSLGRLQNISDLPSDTVLIAYLKEAARLNEQGVKVASQRKSRSTTVKAPDYFLKALNKNKKALAAFEKFPPSHKREYIEYITEAKKEETRQRRMAKSIAQLAKGLEHDWKYK